MSEGCCGFILTGSACLGLSSVRVADTGQCVSRGSAPREGIKRRRLVSRLPTAACDRQQEGFIGTSYPACVEAGVRGTRREEGGAAHKRG